MTWDSLAKKNIEPEPRRVAGVFTYAMHRFPIKGGISMVDVATKQIAPTETPFLTLAAKKKAKP